jgi:hypothetical protein
MILLTAAAAVVFVTVLLALQAASIACRARYARLSLPKTPKRAILN